ncbi:hypothetical protein [Halomonas kalidii]|uniref:Alpha/beta hydrolase n=1 Tax=Halomonas kalidii TaxID=3043293 RepID=A0ABT6VFM5_9GAMM|nr:hypothetical protein [Halomonas kalidii]MDI5932774.1 hypothetical protein [Halomonas kalidii]
MNLFLPDGDGPWPLLVFLHGGYWQELDASATDCLAVPFLARVRAAGVSAELWSVRTAM